MSQTPPTPPPPTTTAAATLSPDDHAQARRAMWAVHAVFAAAGFSFASWLARIPQLRTALDLTPGELGLLLLSASIGSVVALPLAGMTVMRFGARRTITAAALVSSLGLVAVAIGQQVAVWPVALGIVLLGYGASTWDVTMNVEGAAIEQVLDRPIMPHFHASFSLGTVAAALIATGLVALEVPVREHLLVVAVLVAVAVALAARSFLPVAVPVEHHGPRPGRFDAWREPRTLLIGVFVLAFAFTEGAGNDWLAVALIDGHGAGEALGTLAFAGFMATMTLGRWFSPPLLLRYGRVRLLRACSVVALIGLTLFVFGGSLTVAVVGALLWGLGASLGFPVGMSAAADDPAHAAARVSVVSSIAYTAFIAGPPLIGLLGDEVGVLHALTVTGALIVVGLLASGSLAPIERGD